MEAPEQHRALLQHRKEREQSAGSSLGHKQLTGRKGSSCRAIYYDRAPAQGSTQSPAGGINSDGDMIHPVCKQQGTPDGVCLSHDEACLFAYPKQSYCSRNLGKVAMVITTCGHLVSFLESVLADTQGLKSVGIIIQMHC